MTNNVIETLEKSASVQRSKRVARRGIVHLLRDVYNAFVGNKPVDPLLASETYIVPDKGKITLQARLKSGIEGIDMITQGEWVFTIHNTTALNVVIPEMSEMGKIELTVIETGEDDGNDRA